LTFINYKIDYSKRGKETRALLPFKEGMFYPEKGMR